jgi:anti-sigma regulatory factor (Ser/Thr protein kinase)
MAQEFPEAPTNIGPRPSWRILTEFTLDRIVGNEREPEPMDHIAGAVQELNLLPRRVERLQRAVGEAALNAIQIRSQRGAEGPVLIRLLVSTSAVARHNSTDGRERSKSELQAPDSGAKIGGHPLPGGWGFFLVERSVDDAHLKPKKQHHVIEVFLYLEGELSEG